MPGLGGFSRYELQERIGIGGMAEVFRARAFDASGTPHDVVVKKILPHHSEETDFKTMFMDEARIASKLDHPNVVKVLDLGRLDGDLFLTMEFVEGTDLLRLAEWMEGAGRKMPIATALHLTMEVLKGLHHAHTRMDAAGVPMGIVHRDVTPQNVLIGIQGQVKLTDFGIARAANRISHTTVGTIKGNLLYSAPEQVSGAAIDARADVYSSGLLLHRLLAGKHAFDGDDLPKIYQRALSGDIPPVSQLNPSVPTNLDRIVGRATALVPDQRFASADELRRALEDFLLGKQLEVDMQALCSDVRAMRSGLRAAAKKNDGRVLVSQGGADASVLSSVAAPAAPGGDGPTTIQRNPDLDDSDEPTTVQRIPVAALGTPRLATKEEPVAMEDRTATNDVPFEGARLANAPTRLPSRTPAEREVDAWIAEAGAPPEESTMSMPMMEIAAPPPPIVEDETTRNQIPPRAPAKSGPAIESGEVRVASTILSKTPPPVASPAGTPMLSSRPPAQDASDAAPTAIMPPDLVGAGSPKLSSRPPAPQPTAVAPTSISAPEVTAPARTPPPVARPPLSEEDLFSPEPTPASLPIPPAPAPAAAAAPAPAPPVPEVRVPSPSPPGVPTLPPPPSVSNTSSPSRRPAAPLPPWEMPRAPGATPVPVKILETPAMGATVELDDSPPPPVMGTIAIEREAPMPSWATPPASASPSKGGAWLPATPAPMRIEPATPPAAAAFAESTASPFDDLVDPEVSSTVSVVPAATAPPLPPSSLGTPAGSSLEGHTDRIAAVAAVRVGRFVVSASHDHTLRVWDLTLHTTQAVLKGHTGPVTCVALGDDGARVLSGGVDQTVRLWNTESGLIVASMKGHVEPVLACAVSPDGRTALSGGQDRSVRLWDLSSGKEQLVMQGHEQAVAVLAYAGDGSLAVSASLDGMIQMWNLIDGSMLAMFPTGVLGLRALALAKDGRRLVFGGADGQIRMWDVEQGAPLLSFDGAQGVLLGAAISPDGTSVVTAGEDGTARIWDLATGKAGRVYGTHTGPLSSVAFAIDGHTLIGATGNRVCVWDR